MIITYVTEDKTENESSARTQIAGSFRSLFFRLDSSLWLSPSLPLSANSDQLAFGFGRQCRLLRFVCVFLSPYCWVFRLFEQAFLEHNMSCLTNYVVFYVFGIQCISCFLSYLVPWSPRATGESTDHLMSRPLPDSYPFAS